MKGKKEKRVHRLSLRPGQVLCLSAGAVVEVEMVSSAGVAVFKVETTGRVQRSFVCVSGEVGVAV